MSYLLDTNVFIEAKNLYYGFDFCPAFWDWLILQNEAGKVYSIEKVGNELASGWDDLSTWASKLGEKFFLPPDVSVLQSFSTVSKWAQSQKFEPAAVHTFLQIADFYLVAHALSHQDVVVTHEKVYDGIKRIKISNACIALKIRWMNTFDMLRKEHARFVLG